VELGCGCGYVARAAERELLALLIARHARTVHHVDLTTEQALRLIEKSHSPQEIVTDDTGEEKDLDRHDGQV